MRHDLARHEISPISRDVRLRLAAAVGMLAAYLAAVKNDPLTPFQLAFFGASAGWSLALEHRFRKPFFSAPIKIGLIVLGSAIFVLFISGHGRGNTDDFANSIARFLFWNAIVFILSRNKSEYDLWTLAIIELSLFMISGAFVQPPLFIPLLLLSLVTLLYCFQRSAILKCGAAGEAEKGGVGLAVATLVLSLEAGILLFLVFPRTSFKSEKPPEAAQADKKEKPLATAPMPSVGEKIGLPENSAFLDLTSFHKLKADPRPVLRIRVRDLEDRPVPPERTLYLRGAILDTYENGHWSADFKRLRRRDADDGKVDGWTELEPNAFPLRTIVRQQIRTASLSRDLSFVLPDPLRVQWKEARYDPAGILFFATIPKEVLEYQVESALMPIEPPARVAKIPSPPEVYLKVPPGLDRLRELARKETRDYPYIHAKVAQLEQYLRRNGFTYSLDPFVPAQGKDAVEHFLDRRAGYCIHYASALTLLARAAGVPARLATGFQLRDPEEDGSFRVKLSDAHAWVEVWFGPEHGWRVYDATPGSLASSVSGSGEAVPSVDTRKKDEAKEPPARWDHYVVDFDPKTQRQALSDLASSVVGALSTLGTRILSPGVVLGLAGAAIGASVVFFFLPRNRRNRIRQIVGGFRDTTTVDFYRDFLWALSRRGFRKHAGLTPREFALQVRSALDLPGIDFVTEKFCETRYRGTPPTPDERARIDEVISRLLERPDETAVAP
jgi:transglutaminase-like putative cysteine protease